VSYGGVSTLSFIIRRNNCDKGAATVAVAPAADTGAVKINNTRLEGQRCLLCPQAQPVRQASWIYITHPLRPAHSRSTGCPHRLIISRKRQTTVACSLRDKSQRYIQYNKQSSRLLPHFCPLFIHSRCFSLAMSSAWRRYLHADHSRGNVKVSPRHFSDFWSFCFYFQIYR